MKQAFSALLALVIFILAAPFFVIGLALGVVKLGTLAGVGAVEQFIDWFRQGARHENDQGPRS